MACIHQYQYQENHKEAMEEVHLEYLQMNEMMTDQQ